MKLNLFGVFLFCLLVQKSLAQNNRQDDFNNINWVQLFVTKKLTAKTDFLVEYQLRRVDGLKNGQQGLFRTLFQYKPNEQCALGFGYAEVETFPYGDFPIANAGRFPEHRLFEQLILKQKITDFSITHRFRIEQRWLGRIKSGTSREIEEWFFLHRFRYLLKVQKTIHKNLYGWVGDEVFIGAGKNLGVNIFDQNRIHLNLGYKLSNKINIELGYINQLLQQGRLVNSQSIIQRNSGCTFSTNINF